MIFSGSRFGLYMAGNYKFYSFYYDFSDREITYLSSVGIFMAALGRGLWRYVFYVV